MLRLEQFTGTESYHRLTMLANFVCTDGVKYVADTYGAYWLVDAIASYQHEAKVKKEKFQVWKLLVTSKARALLSMTDGNNGKPIITQDIEFTDFPESIDLWLVDGVLMLPSEY